MGEFDNLEGWPPYVWLYSRIGGRPWTHISRDWLLAKRRRVGLFCVLCFALGMFVQGAPVGHAFTVAVLMVVLNIVLSHWFF